MIACLVTGMAMSFNVFATLATITKTSALTVDNGSHIHVGAGTVVAGTANGLGSVSWNISANVDIGVLIAGAANNKLMHPDATNFITATIMAGSGSQGSQVNGVADDLADKVTIAVASQLSPVVAKAVFVIGTFATSAPAGIYTANITLTVTDET
jgi:hypothetical protein